MLYDMNYYDNMNLIHPKTLNKENRGIWDYIMLEFRWLKLDR